MEFPQLWACTKSQSKGCPSIVLCIQYSKWDELFKHDSLHIPHCWGSFSWAHTIWINHTFPSPSPSPFRTSVASEWHKSVTVPTSAKDRAPSQTFLVLMRALLLQSHNLLLCQQISARELFTWTSSLSSYSPNCQLSYKEKDSSIPYPQ